MVPPIASREIRGPAVAGAPAMCSEKPIYQFGPFEFDPPQYELRNGEKRTTLPVALNKLLLIFVSRPGQLVTREQIADALWEAQGTVDTNAGVYTAVKRLRDHIGNDHGQGVIIETVMGAGYRFIAPVSVVPWPDGSEAKIAEAVALPNVHAEQPVRPSWFHRRSFWAAAFVALLGIPATGGIWKWHEDHVQPSTAALADTPEAPFLQHLHPVTFDEPEDDLTAQAVSPSGKLLAWSDRKGISLKTLEGENTRSLVAPEGLRITKIAWLPDESALLVSGSPYGPSQSSEAPGVSQLWRVFLHGERPRLIVEDAASGAVSPDGSHIAFVRAAQTELWVAGTNGDSQRKLVGSSDGSFLTCLLWLATSDKILVSRSEAEIARLPGLKHTPENATGPTHEIVDARSGTLLARRRGIRFDSAAMFDDHLVYPQFTHGAQGLSVVKIDADRGTFLSAPRTIFLEGPFTDSAPDITSEISASNDGRIFSIISKREGMDFYVADLSRASGQPKLEHVTRPFHHPYINYPTSWSPDGAIVAFDQGFHGANSVLGQRMDNAAVMAFAAAKSNSDRFAQGHFSPDGRWLLYLHLSSDSGHVETIERVPVGGGQAEILPVNGQVEAFRCAARAGGRCVVRKVEDKRALVYDELDPARGMGRELARVPWQPTILGDWSLSPDGSTVAMASHDPAHPAIQLIRLSANGAGSEHFSAMQQIPVKGFGTVLEPNWARVGKNLFVETSAQPGHDLLYVNRSGHAVLLRQSPDLLWAVPSPDGKKIAFPESAPPSRNVWVGTAQLDVLR